MNQSQVSIIQSQNIDFAAIGNQIMEVISEKVANQVASEIISYLSIHLKNSENENNQVYYSIKETYEKLRVSRTTLYNWKRDGILLPDGWKGSPVYSKKLVEDFLWSKEV